MHSSLLQVFFQRAIGHEGQDYVWRSVRSIETHPQQSKNVGMMKILHYQTLSQKLFELFF